MMVGGCLQDNRARECKPAVLENIILKVVGSIYVPLSHTQLAFPEASKSGEITLLTWVCGRYLVGYR
jgi:hypothetical protein